MRVDILFLIFLFFSPVYLIDFLFNNIINLIFNYFLTHLVGDLSHNIENFSCFSSDKISNSSNDIFSISNSVQNSSYLSASKVSNSSG